MIYIPFFMGSVFIFETTTLTPKAWYTRIHFQLKRLCYHFNKSLRRWQLILSVQCQMSAEGLETVSVCLCFWRREVCQVCVCPAGPLTVLCGGAAFHWTVMKFPRIIKLELYPYMSPEVRFSSPPAACQFQFSAQTPQSALTSALHF